MDHLTVGCYFFEHGCIVDWPAWVQAIGSIGAIVFAGYLARSTEVQAVNDNNKIVQILMANYQITLQGFIAATEANNVDAHNSQKNEFMQVIDLADNVNLRLIPYVAVVYMITLKKYIYEIRDALFAVDRHGNTTFHGRVFYEAYLAKSQTPIHEIHKAIRNQKWWKLSR